MPLSSQRQIDWCGPKSRALLLRFSLSCPLSDLNAGINKHVSQRIVAEAESFLHQHEREPMIAVGRNDARAPLLVDDGETRGHEPANCA